MRQLTEELQITARRRNPLCDHAGRGQPGRGQTDPGKIQRSEKSGRSLHRSGSLLGTEIRCIADPDTQRGHEHSDQYLDALPVGDQRHVLPIRFLHRSRRPGGTGLSGYGTGCHDDSPFQSGQVPGKDRAAVKGSDYYRLWSAPVFTGMVRRKDRGQTVPVTNSNPGAG